MRTLVLFTALMFATACGHNKTAPSASKTAPADQTAAKSGDRDHDSKVDEAAKGRDKDGDRDDDDDDDGAAKKR